MSVIINPRLFYAFALLALIAASAPAPSGSQRCSTCLTVPPAGALSTDLTVDDHSKVAEGHHRPRAS